MKISKYTGRYCQHTERFEGIKASGESYGTCHECGDFWTLWPFKPEERDAIRRAAEAEPGDWVEWPEDRGPPR